MPTRRSGGALLLVAGGLVALAAGAILLLAGRPIRSIPPAQTFALTNVTVIDVNGGASLPDMTVTIEAGRIASVAPTAAATLPSDMLMVDARGKFLIPGLWDMHVHSAFRRATRARYGRMLVANGITGVRTMGFEVEPEEIGRRTEPRVHADSAEPRSVPSGQVVNGPGGRATEIVAASARDARPAVDQVVQGGGSFVKVYNRLPRDAFLAILHEAHRRDMQVVGHVPFAVPASEASDSGMNSIEHLSGILLECSAGADGLRRELTMTSTSETSPAVLQRRVTNHAAQHQSAGSCEQLAARFARNKTWQTPTLVQLAKKARPVPEEYDHRFSYMPEWKRLREDRADWEQKRSVEHSAADRAAFARELEIVGLLNRTGVPILAGTDLSSVLIVPGFSLHDELALLVETGLTPLQALQTATVNPARFLGAADTLGSVAAGKVADLVLLDADPLRDIRNTRRIAAVVLRGRLLNRQVLDGLLADAKDMAREPRRFAAAAAIARFRCKVAPWTDARCSQRQ